MLADPRPLVMHVMYRFDTGGLENGVVNLINHMPADRYRHAIVALTEVTDFRQRIQRDDVQYVSLHKPPGQGFWLYPALFKLFRRLRPAIVHSRNLAALEVQLPAWLAGVPVRVHGEHGREVGDLDGSNRAYQRVRRFYRPFVSHYIALSRDLAQYLVERVHVAPQRITQAYNGVDSVRFHPAGEAPTPIPGCPFAAPGHWLLGTIGRMQVVKDQLTLTRAFLLALELRPELKSRLRLVLIGAGPLREQCLAMLQAGGAAELAWVPGERNDVPDILRGLSCFVLPSLAEGISNTILEAMASGLPVIATGVGGNADLVSHGRTGDIVPADDPQAMAASIIQMATSEERALTMGRAARAEALAKFSMEAMVATYQGIYDRFLDRGPVPAPLSEQTR